MKADEKRLRGYIEMHRKLTSSAIAGRILENWQQFLPMFIKITPHEYRQALMKMVSAESYIEEFREATHG